MADKPSIVLDPGHGGQTAAGGSSPNNATAPNGLLEKDLTLSLARLLRDRLSGEMNVVLTRDDDRNLALAERAEIARRVQAQIFLSVHFNKAADASVDGTEAWIARQPNSLSRRFARSLVDCLLPVTGARDRGVRQSDFGVLLPSRQAPETGAALVEIAFLSNPVEAQRLSTASYMAQLADALATAVRKNLRTASPAGSIQSLAMQGSGKLDKPQNGNGKYGARYGSLDVHGSYGGGPAEVNDERFSYVPSVSELESLFDAALEETSLRMVVDPDARIRSGPPKFKSTSDRIPRFTRVQVQETKDAYSRVTSMDGSDIGWTASVNLGTLFKDDTTLASVDLGAATEVPIDTTWPAARREVAAVYNRLGGLLTSLSSRTGISIAAALATWRVESHGAVHTVDRAILRFESHLFFDRWGHDNAPDFDAHFQFGTRAPNTGSKCDKRWKCHKFRADAAGDWEDVHVSQESEYAALEVATHLSNSEIAVQCVSIGGPQILVSNYAMLGYDTPQQMYDAFQADERAQVLGFFDYCNFASPGGGLLAALRRQDWRTFASGYNGSSRVDRYSADLQSAYTEAVTAMGTLPVTTQALEGTVNASVSLDYPVELVPQPTKQSCWAASMAMLVGYYGSRTMTPDALASEVNRSLRSSYGWELLEAVKDHFGLRDISLPSNLSYVPTPTQWYEWLSKYGPLWVTVSGSPSHAIVIHGISGDLTASGTTVEVLNPWETSVLFDGDPVDFHPENQGEAYVRNFETFASTFGNMGLSNYGEWRVLYIGKRPAAAEGLSDDDDALSPEELADAEPVGGAYQSAAADVLNAIPLQARRSYPLSRIALGLADVRWASDANSPDYRHLAAPGVSQAFTFTPSLLEQLCTQNRFDVAAGQDEVLFALRGCMLTDGGDSTGWTASADISESIPDHNDFHCVLGVWKRSTSQFNLFRGSTVPNWKLMENYRQGGDGCNLVPTGRYTYEVGTHRKGTKGEIRGAFREHENLVVLRTLDDLEYTIGDTWDSGFPGDNIHPGRLGKHAHGPFFSSAGCQTVPGDYSGQRHTGSWADFRTAAGLSASAPDSENGTLFVYILLTGRDARLAAAATDMSTLARLRFGSSGDEVKALQEALAASGASQLKMNAKFDAATKIAYLNWQKGVDSSTADGIVTAASANLLAIPFGSANSSTPVTQSLGMARAMGDSKPTAGQIIAQFDMNEGTSFTTYDGYVSSLVDATVFGKSIHGLHAAFLRKLRAAEKELVDANGGDAGAVDWGLVKAGGWRRSDGWHNWGLAVDLNYDSSPYVMHERHEQTLGKELGPVYERIAQFVCARSSVIPMDITQGSPALTRTAQLYDSLKEESDAMIQYFAWMTDTAALAASLAALPADKDWSAITGSTSAPDAAAMQSIMMADYVKLAGRSGPPAGRDYPAVTKVLRDDGKAADRPFAGDPLLRGPEKGFITLKRELVLALSRAGLRWGAIDFGAESGDVMHFDDGNGAVAGKIGRAKRAAQAAIAGSQGLSLSLEENASACSANDAAIDASSCLLFSAAAPLAAKQDCDQHAVWTYVPSTRTDAFSVMVYLHGLGNTVVADAEHPGGREASWVPGHMPTPLTTHGPTASGPKYQMGEAAESSVQKPLVLIPEIGVLPNKGSTHWTSSSAGRFATDTGALQAMLDDCYGKLSSLQKPSGEPYVTGGAVCPNVRRLFLAGHSGGGVALGPACSSVLAYSVPTDLWLMDCTYDFGVDKNYVDFCQHWSAWVDPAQPDSAPQARLGNDAQSSRMVVITTQDSKTTDRASSIINKLTAPWNSPAGRVPGLTAVTYTNGQLRPRSGSTMPDNPQIIEIVETRITPDVEELLKQYPIVFIHPIPSRLHDYIPRDWTPLLLKTAAVATL